MAKREWVWVTGLAAALLSLPAVAWVEVCNNSGQRVDAAVALGAMDPPGVSTGGHLGVTVEGWWKLAPGECAVVSEADARQSWLYFHADGKRGSLQGRARLCVRNRAFTSSQQFLKRNETCRNGWKEAGFIRHQSSKRNYRYTIN